MSLKDKIANLPQSPGCYLMKDARNKILYVGKAKRLKSRVSQYFTGDHDYKTSKLVTQIKDFDFIVTNTEKEALILEITLIKQYRPRYNIMFMDDKSYPYIKLKQGKSPSLAVVREFKKDRNALYFGPYPNATAAHKLSDLLNLIYPIRKEHFLSKRAYHYYQLDKVNENTVPDESGMIKDIIRILKGDNAFLKERLSDEMNKASEELQFEKAKEFRDYLQALDYINDRQTISQNHENNQDVFHIYEKDGILSIVILIVRQGVVTNRRSTTQVLVDDALESLENYVLQYYSTQERPRQIVLPRELDASHISSILNIKVIQPHHGQFKDLLDLAKRNAEEQHRQFSLKVKRENEQEERVLEELRAILKLESAELIELYDNSHTAGDLASSAKVAFRDGQASKKDYRLYKVSHGADDMRNMEEVLTRRFLRALKEGTELPDVIFVDGGLTQLETAQRVLRDFDLSIPVFGLVKDHKHTTSRLLDTHGEITDLKQHEDVFYLLTRMQDEVHRFVLSYHQKRRSKALVESQLDHIEGIGPQRKMKLLKHFKSVNAIKKASVEELSKIIPQDIAIKLIEALSHEK